MLRQIGRLALVAGLGIGAFVLADAVVPSFGTKDVKGDDAVEPEVIDVTPEN